MAADAMGTVMWGIKTDVPPSVPIGIAFVSVGLIGVLAVQSLRLLSSMSCKRINWCPGWESNPHEEKSPEDFKLHTHRKQSTYRKCDHLLRIATTRCIASRCAGFRRTWSHFL